MDKVSRAISLKELDEFLTDPNVGIEGDTGNAIRELFYFVFTGKPMEPKIERKWRELGRLTESNQLTLERGFEKRLELEIILLALQFEGIVERKAQEPRQEGV